MKAYLRKLANQTLMPDNQESADYIRSLKIGAVVSAEVKRPRNYEFHKKWFSLVEVGFDYYEPEVEYKGQVIEKNFNRFRKDITILAGFFHMVPSLRGGARAEADSIAFAHMSQEDFELLYSKTIDVLLKFVMTQFTRDELIDVAQKSILEYA